MKRSGMFTTETVVSEPEPGQDPRDRRRVVATVHRHGGAVARQTQRDGAPDSTTSARNQRTTSEEGLSQGHCLEPNSGV